MNINTKVGCLINEKFPIPCFLPGICFRDGVVTVSLVDFHELPFRWDGPRFRDQHVDFRTAY